MYNQIIILGIIVSIIFTELTQISPAGFIVPSYIVLCLSSPTRIVYTLAVALVTFLICKALGQVVILYGRRRFALMILMAFFVDYILQWIVKTPTPSLIGVLIPGIIANEFEKQGVVKSLCGLTICVALTSAVLMFSGSYVFRL